MPTSALAGTTEVAALRYATLRLSRRLRKQAGVGLTPTQVSALATLERHGEMRVGELARLEGISKSSVTRLAARLEGMGHLRRSVDPEDSRGFLIELTELGLDVLAAANDRENSYLTRQIAALDDEDQQRLLAALPALTRLLDVKA